MLRQTIVALAGAFLVSGCAVHPPLPESGPPAESLRWVEGPTPDVRTLLLGPTHVGAIEGAGHAPAEVEIGAFFARFDGPSGPMDQLALMIEVRGADAPELLRRSRQLLLEVDGDLFVGEPGTSENSFRVDLAADRPRATVVIPVAPELLERLADADVVRGRLGLWAAFSVPPACRSRFRELLRALPEGASSTTLRASRLRRVTETD